MAKTIARDALICGGWEKGGRGAYIIENDEFVGPSACPVADTVKDAVPHNGGN
jgi:hypothetical protein